MKSSTAGSAAPELAIVPTPIDDEKMLSMFGVRDRGNFERHVQEREGVQADRWRRMVRLLLTLAPMPGKFIGANVMQFFIADGKYRKQVFALQSMDDGAILICLPDVLRDAVKRRILVGSDRVGTEGGYRPFDSERTLTITKLDGKMINPDSSFRDMVGWNRKALKIELPADSTDELVNGAEQLCALAAEEWKAKIAK